MIPRWDGSETEAMRAMTANWALSLQRYMYIFFTGALAALLGCAKVDIEMVQRVHGGSAAEASGPIPTLLLEYDSIEPARAVTEKRSGTTLESAYCLGDYPENCDGLMISVEGGSSFSAPSIDPGPCITKSSLDQQIGCSKDLHPGRGQWYAHGLAIPWHWSSTDEGGGRCEKFNGVIWLTRAACNLPEKRTSGHEKGTREDFVVVDNWTREPDELMESSLHELGHVLNLHHEDYEDRKSVV